MLITDNHALDLESVKPQPQAGAQIEELQKKYGLREVKRALLPAGECNARSIEGALNAAGLALAAGKWGRGSPKRLQGARGLES